MTREVPLYTSAQANLDGTGSATVIVGPNTYGHTWTVDNVSCVTTSVTDTQFFLYRNIATNAGQIGGSWSGNQDFASPGITLNLGERLIGVWSGGDPGAMATMVISGTVKDVR